MENKYKLIDEDKIGIDFDPTNYELMEKVLAEWKKSTPGICEQERIRIIEKWKSWGSQIVIDLKDYEKINKNKEQFIKITKTLIKCDEDLSLFINNLKEKVKNSLKSGSVFIN